MLAWNQEQESLNKITILCLNWKYYFSFERGKKFFIFNSIVVISCVFSYCLHYAFEEIWFRVWCSLLSILVVTNKFFKLPSSLLLCMLCVHIPLEEMPFKVWHSLSIYPSSYRWTLLTHLLLCVLCVHCAFHQEIWFRVWRSLFYLSSYK